MSEITIERYDRNGAAMLDGNCVLTFSILGASESYPVEADKGNYNRFIVLGDRVRIEGYTIATHGSDNNLPDTVKQYVSNNPVLPEILKKQIRMMYGQGPGLYQQKETDTPGREWVSDKYPDVFKWFNSWDTDQDLEPLHRYLKLAIHDYYYMEGLYNKWMFNKSRRTGGNLPVRGLKFLNGARCRLGTTKVIDTRMTIKDEECDLVLFAHWDRINIYEMVEYQRFENSNPLKYPVCVNYVRDNGFDEDIYSLPTYFYGLMEWIKGSNLSPKYVNSYLKNSLSAKIHVIIPNAWIANKEETLKSICRDNEARKANNKKLITEYEGITGIGAEFSLSLLEKLIDSKIKQVTELLAGQGENQGKAFWSRSFLTEQGLETWDFKEIPMKYKEFTDSILSFNTNSMKMILAGKGLDPAISNLGNDGIFNSGSQIYYSYLVYLDTLGYAEEYILEDLNRALWINFPILKNDNVKLGFKRFAPPRQSETAPANRMDATNQNKNNQMP